MIFGQISSAMSSLINSHHLSRSTLEQECLALQKSCSKTHSLICKWSWFFVKLYYPPLAFMALSYVYVCMYVHTYVVHMHGGAFWPSNRPLGKEQPWRDKDNHETVMLMSTKPVFWEYFLWVHTVGWFYQNWNIRWETRL